MKKLLFATSAVALFLGMTGVANADCNGIYFGVRGGATRHNYSYKNKIASSIGGLDEKWKFMMSGAIGYRYNYYRTELEYVWRHRNKWSSNLSSGAKANEVSLKTYSYMWNHYIDFAPYNWWTPYVSAGIGFTKMNYKSVSYSEYEHEEYDNMKGRNSKPTRFTWSLGGGVTVKVTNRFNVDAGYRYYDMNSVGYMDVDAHEIYGGVRYVF